MGWLERKTIKLSYFVFNFKTVKLFRPTMASINELYSRGRKEGKAQIFFQIFVTETPKRQKPIAKLIRFKAETSKETGEK